MMQPTHKERFRYALASMELFFRDPLTDGYKDLYFTVATQKGWTIEEWEGACMLALGCETFHAVPLPGIMQRYIDEIREAAWRHLITQQRQQDQEQKQIEAAGRREEAMLQLEASQAKLARLWGEEWLAQHQRMMDPNNVEKEKD